MAINGLKQVSLLAMGGGIGGLVGLAAATLPALLALVGVGGAILLALSVWSPWMGVLLLFVILIGLRSSAIPREWQTSFFGLSLLLVVLFFLIKRREAQIPRNPLMLPVLCWTGIVGFSIVPALRYGIAFKDWYREAWPFLLPALIFVFPRRFIEPAPLKRFFLVSLLLALPVLWNYGVDYIQYQGLLGPSAMALRGSKGGTFLWWEEGLEAWLFFALSAFSVYDPSKVKRAIFTMLAACTFLMIFLWARRTGLAAFLGSSLLFVVLLYREQGWLGIRQAARLWLVIGLVLAVGLLALGLSGYVLVPKLLVTYGGAYLRGFADPSVQWRGSERALATPAILESPWLGHGFGYIVPGIGSIYQRGFPPFSFIHNLWLNLLVKTGFIGLAVFVWFMVAAVKLLYRLHGVVADRFYKGLWLAGISALMQALLRSPLDDVLTSTVYFPLAVVLAIAVYLDADLRRTKKAETR